MDASTVPTEKSTKRRKLSVNGPGPAGSRKKENGCLFAPFRTIGLVSPTSVPFTTVALGTTTFQITTSVGRSLHTYDLRRGLNLVFVSRPQTPAPITAIRAWRDQVLAAWGDQFSGENGVWILKRGRLVKHLPIPDHINETVQRIEVFGSWILAVLQTCILVWSSDSFTLHTVIKPLLRDISLSSALCCAPTYLNKILIGRRDGSVELWNVRTSKLIYTFQSRNDSSVEALEPSPALGIVAVGYADGTIQLLNIDEDSVILEIHGQSLISSISFRTDGLGAGSDHTQEGIMAVSHQRSGDVVFWDLNHGGKIQSILYGAHNPALASGECGGITRIEFLLGQDVLLTAGKDNALKSWIFDANSLNPLPRILHSRGGHAAPITCLEFLPSSSDGADASGKWIISGGRDRSCWAWSVRRDGQSSELSQGAIRRKAEKLAGSLEELKVPEITHMACCMNRDGGMGAAADAGGIWTNKASKKGNTADTSTTGWESVITAHRGDALARTWFWGRKRAGRWAFQTPDRTEVTSVAISPCGTFALVGSTKGSLTMYNLQSGILRQKFPKKSPTEKHDKSITGIAVDALNRSVISCGLDGKTKFWNFKTGTLTHEIDWTRTIAILSLKSHRHNDLIGLSCSDLAIRIVDSETKKCVRELWGATAPLTDFCFSHDARWVVAASLDGTLRVWDIPTGHLINGIKLDSTCSALAFCDSGEFLATAHTNEVGVKLWNNRNLFVRVPTKMVNEDDLIRLEAPTSAGEQNPVNAAYEEGDESNESDLDISAPDSIKQLDCSLQSLSLVPKSRWKNLVHIEAIRTRNKPKLPPQKPEKAPFFLSSLVDQATETPKSRITDVDPNNYVSNFDSIMANPSNLVEELSNLPPSAADIEIRSLSGPELPTFIRALTARLRQKRDFELVQAWMSVFLRLHADAIVADASEEFNGFDALTAEDDITPDNGLRDALIEWRDVATAEQKRLNDLLGYCAGVLTFLRSSR